MPLWPRRWAAALGVDPAAAAAGLAEAAPVPGRFESVQAGQDFAVIIDYAHTPDGLAAVLHAARSLTERSLTVVFGAGGDRDRRKRPEMGARRGQTGGPSDSHERQPPLGGPRADHFRDRLPA